MARPDPNSMKRQGWRRVGAVGASLLMLGLACTKLPTAPARVIDFEFEVQDREGTPIADALIVMEPRGPRSPSWDYSARTDDAGHTRFRIPEGVYVSQIYSPDYGPYAYDTLVPEVIVAASAPRFVYRLAGAYVSGEIRGPNGVALSAGEIEMSGYTLDGRDYSYLDHFLTGPTFRLLVPHGTYYITALGGGAPSPYPAVTLRSIPITKDTTMIFQLLGKRVEGVVAGRGGTPIPGASVFASGVDVRVTARTDASGEYFVYVPDGSYRWTVTPGDSSRYILPRHFPGAPLAGPATVNFSLDGAYWSGTVLTEGTGTPQAGKYVIATPWLDPSRAATSRTDNQGAFHLLLETGMEYDLRLRDHPDYGTWAVIRAGVANADSTFTLTWPATPASGAPTFADPR
ncbi:MAG TPA: carboxypeptidase-like regulatory domain-containing protein [Candidatus Eisenbacteria bacterium]|nr:carboxypeptidase-like regulatory domain-containing protein [Candidatus Eisenbacteria bacterium]